MPMSWPRGVVVHQNGSLKLVHVTDFHDPLDRNSNPGLYLEFASLDESNLEAVIRFASRYGLLGLETRRFRMKVLMAVRKDAPRQTEVRIEELLSGIRPRRTESLDDFRTEVNRMRTLLKIWQAYWKSDTGRLAALLPDTAVDAPTETLLANAAARLAREVNAQISGHVSPMLTVTGGRWTVSFLARDLLSAMYQMLLQDIAGPFAPRQCENETCRNYFLPSREAQVFCSRGCGDAQRVRRSRRSRRSKTKDQRRKDDA